MKHYNTLLVRVDKCQMNAWKFTMMLIWTHNGKSEYLMSAEHLAEVNQQYEIFDKVGDDVLVFIHKRIYY